ncbi:lysozyme-like protein [uncultured Mediterranean phage uvMED]|nr:lysozyme-like protein [uncultured Mediterranean phage uvMED]
MPKLPVFEVEGSVTQLGGTTTNVQVPLTQTLGTALKPVTDFVVKQKVQEKNFENKTEALKLENNFITDMAKVYDEVNVLENKDQAQLILKEKSDALIASYGDKATNINVKTLFNNAALSEVQKGIFRVNTQISKNILTSLQNQVNQKEERLLANAFLAEGDFDYSVLATDLEKLYKDHYDGRIPNANLKALVDNIPSTIQIFEATKGISDNPRLTLLNLKNPEKFKDIPLEKRLDLTDDAKKTLTPVIQEEFNNYIAAANRGKKIEFDIEFAKEVLPEKQYSNYVKKYNIATETVIDASILNSVPLKDLSETLEGFINDKYEKYGEVDAQALENNLKNIVATRLEEMKTDPVNFLIGTNDDIKNALEEIRTETNDELRQKKKLEFTNLVYETQVKMGVPNYEIQVTSIPEAQSFVEQYINSDESTRLALLQNAENEFGEFFSKALNEYSAQGLPITAELSAFFVNPNLTKKFLSFDSKDEQDKLKQLLIDEGTSFSKVRQDVFDGLAEFSEKIMFANKFDTSAAADKLDRIVEVLTYFAANEMRIGVNQTTAVKTATALFGKQNFRLEDTYFIPKIYNGTRLSERQVDFVVEKAKKTLVYIDSWGVKSFGSKDDTIGQIELDTDMKEAIKEDGKWVNNTDGTGIIFGIVLSDNSFAPVFNQDGQTLEIMFDDDSFLLPNTDIDMFTQKKLKRKKKNN